MKSKLSMDKKTRDKQTVDLPEDYKILNIVINGRNIVANIQEMMELANEHNEAEVLASMNKATSNYHYFSRLEFSLEELLINEEERLKLWMAAKKSKFSDKEASSEVAKERRVLVEFKELYEKKTNRVRSLRNYKTQCSIARKSLERHVDMIKSIGAMIRGRQSDPGATPGSKYV